MENKLLGTTQVRVPEIGLGTWKFKNGTVESLRAGIDRGAFLIDTAEIYGSEELVGQAVRGRRKDVFLATKVSPRNFRKRDLIAAAERSLQKLGTDYIDLYQLHWPNYTIPIAETMGAMEELAEQGKIRFIGVSNFAVGQLKKAQSVLTRHKIVSNQVRYSVVERTIEAGLLGYCQKHGITVIAYSPLASGFSEIESRDPNRVLAHVAAQTGKTEAQIALNWCIANDNVIAIPKAATVAHAVENCGASGWRLSPPEYEMLDKQIRFERRGPAERLLRRNVARVYQLLGRRI